jgi:hypothetical protein
MKLPKNPLWPMSPWARFEGEGGDGGGGGDPPPVALVDHEGNFRENWKDDLDEDIRNAPCLNEVAGFKDLVKQHVHGQRSIGKNKVALPDESASDEDWNEFYNQVGRPKVAGDYAYTRPEGVPESHRTDEQMEEIRKAAHGQNLTQRQFNKIMAADDARVIAKIADDEATAIRETDEAETKLKEEWGMAYEERIHIVNRFINETTVEGEDRDRVIKKFGRDPDFIRWAADVGKTLVEHDALIADLTQKAPKEAQAELDEWHATDDYQKFMRGEFATSNPSKHANMMRKETELYDIIHPPKKTG